MDTYILNKLFRLKVNSDMVIALSILSLIKIVVEVVTETLNNFLKEALESAFPFMYTISMCNI